jgi:hypothetical protein
MLTKRFWIAIGFSLASVALFAQNNPPAATAPSLDLTGLPAGRGVYYRAGAEWVALSPNVLMPFWEGRDVALEILNVGSDHTISEIEGSHSGIQLGQTRPTFYLHGINTTNLYLVRATPKEDYREVRMPVSRHFRRWAHYRSEDLVGLDVEGINGDVVAVRPTADLKPGEYALASGVQQGDRWLKLGFDFGILAPGGR